MLALLALGLGPLALIVLCLYGYFEGTTGQTLGKKALGIYTIRADTGEFIGGAAGIGRKLLHFLDSIALFTGWIVGLITGRTYADRIVGTVVVRIPARHFSEAPSPAADVSGQHQHEPGRIGLPEH